MHTNAIYEKVDSTISSAKSFASYLKIQCVNNDYVCNEIGKEVKIGNNLNYVSHIKIEPHLYFTIQKPKKEKKNGKKNCYLNRK